MIRKDECSEWNGEEEDGSAEIRNGVYMISKHKIKNVKKD